MIPEYEYGSRPQSKIYISKGIRKIEEGKLSDEDIVMNSD
jgi:hypothetical protein